MKEIMRFAVGQHFVCVEGQPSKGYVDFRIREGTVNGRPGRTVSVGPQRRSELTAIGMGLLAVAGAVTPEQAFDQSQAVGTERKPTNRIPMRASERELVEKIVSAAPGEPERSIQIVNSMYRKLQRRMHVVQRCVQLMEVLNDQDAQQIDLLLTLAATGRPLPFSIHIAWAAEPAASRNSVGLAH
ncbi:hypothetical protein [Achromobacter aegrifaciens]